MTRAEAIALILRNDGDFYRFAGPRNGQIRAALHTAVTGTKQTQAQSGVNAIRAAWWTYAGIQGDTIDRRDRAFLAWLQAQDDDQIRAEHNEDDARDADDSELRHYYGTGED